MEHRTRGDTDKRLGSDSELDRLILTDFGLHGATGSTPDNEEQSAQEWA